jgi:diadenosine tetraphosphate (Ap4A) HIT family hydrolase
MAKYKSSTKTGKCIFCEIASGRIKPMSDGGFWENKKYMAWLSPFPSAEGFSVIIPKKHYPSDALNLPDKDLKEFIIEAKKVSKILLKNFKDVGRVGLIMEGTGVDHAHIKLIPMHGTGHMKKGIWKQYASGKSDYFEKYDGYLVSNDGPKADPEKLKKLAEKLKNIHHVK